MSNKPQSVPNETATLRPGDALHNLINYYEYLEIRAGRNFLMPFYGATHTHRQSSMKIQTVVVYFAQPLNVNRDIWVHSPEIHHQMPAEIKKQNRKKQEEDFVGQYLLTFAL